MSEIYYQTTVSKTKFYPGNVDDENVDLDGYRAYEKQRIFDFLDNDNNVMLCGGLSSMQKTEMIDDLYLTNQMAGLDLIGIARSLVDTSMSKIPLLTKDIIDKDIDSNHCKNLLIDEGVILFFKKIRKKTEMFINCLLNDFHKIIIFGGGAAFTADEQNERMAELMPGDSKIEYNPFEFKNLNVKQTADVISSQYLRQDIILSVDVLNIMAESYLEYYRIVRPIRQTYLLFKLLHSENRVMPFIKRLSILGFMPRSVTNSLFIEQKNQFLKTIKVLRETKFIDILDTAEKRNVKC